MLGTANKLKTARNINLSGAITGNANFDGSGDITINTSQGNLAVITGSVTLEANTSQQLDDGETQQTSWSVAYPQGYNKDNCVLISFASGFFPETRGYGYGKNKYHSLAMLTGNIEKCCFLGIPNIHCYAENYTTYERTLYYKIVLLKLS